MLDKLFEKWLDDVFVMLMSKSKKEVARLAFRAGYHACESAQHGVHPTGELPASDVWTMPEDLPAPVVRLDPPISG